MKKLSEVRFGFIGAGQIANYAAEAVLRHPDARLVAIQDLSVDRLKVLQKKHSLQYFCLSSPSPKGKPSS